MLPEAVSLGELALKVLSSLRITKSNRKKIAKLFTSLYRDLEMLIENGDRILKSLRKHNSGHRINRARLTEMLKEQEVIIKRINSLLRRRDVRTVLSLRARQLRPLDVLVHGKGEIVTLLLERVEKHRRRFDFDLFPFVRFARQGRLKLPNNASINRSRKNLRQIRVKLDELRSFIIANFEIHEVM